MSSLPLFACTSTEPQRDKSLHSPSTHINDTPALQVTFETTEANRQRARNADQPVLLKGQAAVYPNELIELSIGNGWVELLIGVNVDGSVVNTQVLSSSHPAFEPAAIASVEPWLFEPQTKQKSIRHRVFFKHEPADHYQPTGIDQ